jgi:hypothetical protein
LANFLLAVAVDWPSLYAGHTMVTPLIGQVTQDSPAALAGIKTAIWSQGRRHRHHRLPAIAPDHLISGGFRLATASAGQGRI